MSRSPRLAGAHQLAWRAVTPPVRRRRAGGQQAAQGRGAAPAGGQAPAGQGRGGPPAAPAGITVAGEVRNYVPVTDAMLRNPDPGDWLMIRRDYRASNYSPLNQITRDNVKNLRLVWSWAMNEGGTNQPAPIVHNGVIYLNNPGNTIQALDGKTGDVIWENRYGTAANAAAMRGIAMYDDKIFAATSDARLFAFDARTGKTVWETTIGDRSKGNYTTSSGPLVAKGKVIQGLGACQTYREEKCFISAYDAATGKEVWRFNTVAQAGEPGGDTWGKLPNLFRAGTRIVDYRQLRSGAESHVLGNGAGEAVDADQPRHVAERRRALHQLDARARCRYRQAGLAFSARARRSARSRRRLRARCSSTTANENLLFTVGKDGILWKLDRKTGQYLGHKETVFQNVWDELRSQDRQAVLPARHPRAAGVRRLGPGLPEHRRRPQLAGVELITRPPIS